MQSEDRVPDRPNLPAQSQATSKKKTRTKTPPRLAPTEVNPALSLGLLVRLRLFSPLPYGILASTWKLVGLRIHRGPPPDAHPGAFRLKCLGGSTRRQEGLVAPTQRRRQRRQRLRAPLIIASSGISGIRQRGNGDAASWGHQQRQGLHTSQGPAKVLQGIEAANQIENAGPEEGGESAHVCQHTLRRDVSCAPQGRQVRIDADHSSAARQEARSLAVPSTAQVQYQGVTHWCRSRQKSRILRLCADVSRECSGHLRHLNCRMFCAYGKPKGRDGATTIFHCKRASACNSR